MNTAKEIVISQRINGNITNKKFNNTNANGSSVNYMAFQEQHQALVAIKEWAKAFLLNNGMYNLAISYGIGIGGEYVTNTVTSIELN